MTLPIICAVYGIRVYIIYSEKKKQQTILKWVLFLPSLQRLHLVENQTSFHHVTDLRNSFNIHQKSDMSYPYSATTGLIHSNLFGWTNAVGIRMWATIQIISTLAPKDTARTTNSERLIKIMAKSVMWSNQKFDVTTPIKVNAGFGEVNYANTLYLIQKWRALKIVRIWKYVVIKFPHTLKTFTVHWSVAGDKHVVHTTNYASRQLVIQLVLFVGFCCDATSRSFALSQILALSRGKGFSNCHLCVAAGLDPKRLSKSTQNNHYLGS